MHLRWVIARRPLLVTNVRLAAPRGQVIGSGRHTATATTTGDRKVVRLSRQRGNDARVVFTPGRWPANSWQ